MTRFPRLGLALVVLGGLSVRASGLEPVPYPEDFRKWTFVKSGPSAARGGVHHIFANNKAIDGYKSGKFPDGSAIAFEVIGTTDLASLPMEGPRLVVDVMVKDSALYPQTGGWGFEEFSGDSKTNRVLNAAGQQSCFACHAQQKDFDYVISRLAK